MLGCQDFCGYYDWTFSYVRRRWGQDALATLLAEAIAGDSQQHYARPVAGAALRGLYDAWVQTGHDEHCDWTFTLDEDKNVLRCDMRECPSKGFLTRHDLHADEDYCNHCIGWMVPLLRQVGAEILEHAHNHCGQCWTTMRQADRPSRPLELEIDIRKDQRWRRGYLDRWVGDVRQPLASFISPSGDPSEVLSSWLRDKRARVTGGDPIVLSDTAYNAGNRDQAKPAAVLIGYLPADLAATAARWWAASPEHRPLLLHPFLPAEVPVDFLAAGLPRPLPILPFLIRSGKYIHRPGGPHPTTDELIAMLEKTV